jgi:hypothetical protein
LARTSLKKISINHFYYGNDLFPSKEVNSIAEILLKSISASVDIYPDSMYENWGIPTGLNIRFSKGNEFVLPTFLCDVGCGFLLFKISFKKKIQKCWIKKTTEHLSNTFNNHVNAKKISILEIENFLFNGLLAFNEIPSKGFLHKNFSVDEDILMLDLKTLKLLSENFYQLSNNIEFKNIDSIHDQNTLKEFNILEDDVICFIHTGSGVCENILEQKFAYLEAEYCLKNNLFSPKEIEKGIFGIPLNTNLGLIHYEWMKASANYALANRYSIFSSIKTWMEEKFPCEVVFINDKIHCHMLEHNETNGKIFSAFRGVQHVYPSTMTPYNLTLLAGYRETISFLLSSCENNNTINMASHGTSGNISNNFNYEKFFGENEKIKFYGFMKEIHCNSKINEANCLPYTYNILKTVQDFYSLGIARPIACLSPLLNIKGSKVF